jgi:hypothetical protein
VADVTMCPGANNNKNCPMKDNCYRYTAKPAPLMQSWFIVMPLVTVGLTDRCNHHLPLERVRK